MVEKFFWADKIAEDIIKKRGKGKEYICASGITPSGTIHIGNFREVITTDLVVRALRDKGKKVDFIYSWDDYDRFRKVPANIPKNYEKYIGMSLSEIPATSGKGSYAEYFEKIFEKELKKVDIVPRFIRQSVMNKKCKYAELIKIAIKKRKETINILNKYRKEPLSDNWFPLVVYCEKCKKDFTKIISAKDYEIVYKCKCGFKNKIDYRKKGIVKLLWRVDWPMRWSYYDEDFEPGGIDHSVYGGSIMTSDEIDRKIFEHEPPIHVFYEWVKIKGGKEFSSSLGNVLTLSEVEKIYEPEVLRYIFVGTKPRTGFQISFDNDVIKIYEDYDNLEERYYEKKANSQEKRIYELSRLKINKKKPERISFRHLITIVQIGKINELKDEIKERAKRVKNWLEKYAGEDMKFEIQKKIKYPFRGKEKKVLIELRESLKTRDFKEDELFNEFYNICQKLEIKNTDFFKTAYKSIIGKEKGPRLAGLILAVGKDKIIKLLNQIK